MLRAAEEQIGYMKDMETLKKKSKANPAKHYCNRNRMFLVAYNKLDLRRSDYIRVNQILKYLGK